MNVFIDADACPVVKLTEKISAEHKIPVVILCDTNHIISSEYSSVITVGAGADAVDLALINRCRRGDIVVTQDYGVAALALGRGAAAIHQSGMVYSDDNIDSLLAQRHLAKKLRNSSSKHHFKGPKKRTAKDDEAFCAAFTALLCSMSEKSI